MKKSVFQSINWDDSDKKEIIVTGVLRDNSMTNILEAVKDLNNIAKMTIGSEDAQSVSLNLQLNSNGEYVPDEIQLKIPSIYEEIEDEKEEFSDDDDDPDDDEDEESEVVDELKPMD